MQSAATDLLFPVVAAAAVASVASLVVLQTDRASRWTLSPPRLMAKRRQEYDYHWKTAVEKAHLQMDYCLAGGSEIFHADPEMNLKHTTYLSSDEEQDSLVQRIISKDTHVHFSVLKVDRDPHDPTGEFYLFLMGQEEGCEHAEFFQAPLIPFCTKLKIAFENQLTTTVFCFVADASSGKASGLLEELVQEAKTDVAVISEPLWMVNLARLSEAQVYSKSKLQTVMFGLCRLDAWSLREQVQSSHTVLVTLPGQGTVATLLPLAQAVFPEDRHIFAYDGCVASVARGIRQAGSFRRGTLHTDLNNIRSRLAQNPTRHTTPLPTRSPLTKSILTLEDAFASVPISQAGIVESWMSSVDAFIKLKEDERSTGYVPYVLKLSLLTNPVGDFAPLTDSYLSLSSLFQFITGSRSRPVSDGVMDAGREFLKDYNRDHHEISSIISETEMTAIENCVFQHKGILIGKKTLKDTVLPKQHWTLKQASRGGCSCCDPDPFDEEMEENQEETRVTSSRLSVAGVDVTSPFASTAGESIQIFATATIRDLATSKTSTGTGYVDGKRGFAFDPTKFAQYSAS